MKKKNSIFTIKSENDNLKWYPRRNNTCIVRRNFRSKSDLKKWKKAHTYTNYDEYRFSHSIVENKILKLKSPIIRRMWVQKYNDRGPKLKWVLK